MSRVVTENGLFPLTTYEFYFYLSENPRQPGTGHVELRVPGRFDESRLREAFVAASMLHPMSRVRLAPQSRRQAVSWELVNPSDFDMERIVRAVSIDDERDLSRIRNEFISTYLDLRHAPALRLLVIHRDGGDSLLIIINHTISDGAGLFRFLQSIARAYAGQPDPVSSKDPISSRYLMNSLKIDSPEPAPGPPRRRAIATKIRPQPASVDEPKYGELHVHLSEVEVQSLDPRRFASDAMLNDLLLGAFLRTIDAWNGRETGDNCNLVVTVPFNPRHMLDIRPSELMINMAMAGRLIMGRDQLTDERATMSAVVAQTQWLKNGGVDVIPTLSGWSRRLVVAALPVLKHWGRPTAFLTNLGRSRGYDFGPAGSVAELWVGGNTGMPTGLLIGAALLNGALFLTFCYRHALFDDAAAERFANLYRSQLRALGSSEEPNQES